MIISAEQLIKELKELGFLRVEEPMDTIYTCPSLKWLTSFYRWTSLFKFKNESFDCEDFALRAVTDATKSLNFKNTGHTFLMCKVIASSFNPLCGVTTGGRHSLNIVKLDDGQWYFYEPQNRKHMLFSLAVKTEAVYERSFVLP